MPDYTADFAENHKNTALGYPRRAWHVFPVHEPLRTEEDGRVYCACQNPSCSNRAKHPKTRNGVKDATMDLVQIEAWWDRWPTANIGIATGAISGIIVLDFDGDKGRASLEALEAEHGPLPDTYTVASGRADSGKHLYYRYPDGQTIRNSGDRLGKGIDIKSDGGYVVAPPSLHVSGNRYVVLNDTDPAEAPSWLLDLIADASRKSAATADAGGTVTEGRRNDTLIRLAGAMRRQGCDEETILAGLLARNNTFSPPLGEDEVRRVAASGARFPEPQQRYALTDTGNAERLIAAHGADLRYCHDLGAWLVWNGKRWHEDRNGEVERRATRTVRSIYGEAERAEDADERKRIVNWAKTSESAQRRRAMIEIARTWEDVAITTADLNTDNRLFNVNNGTLDLRTGELKAHDRANLITKITDVDYYPDAEAPEFERFLWRIFAGRKPLISFMQRYFGYALTGDVSEQKLAFAHGTGANGKSTLVTTMFKVMGDYGKQADSSLLVHKDRKAGSATPEIVALFGARFVASMEPPENERLGESFVKQITGGDRLIGRDLYRGLIEFDPTHKILLSANNRPEIRGTDHGIWRRIMLIPFTVRIPEAEQDKDLPEKLEAELPGILAWAVQGCLEWQRQGLNPPEVVKAATQEYRREMDNLADFFDECCEFDADAWTESAEIMHRYRRWCMDEGREIADRGTLHDRLRAEGCEPKRRKMAGKKVRGWHGMRLLPEAATNIEVNAS